MFLCVYRLSESPLAVFDFPQVTAYKNTGSYDMLGRTVDKLNETHMDHFLQARVPFLPSLPPSLT